MTNINFIMTEHKTKVRVRYSETDQMGYVHHSNYALYFETARLAWLKSLGISYKEMEAGGVMLPVYTMHIRYHKPAFYDDELHITTRLKEPPGARITFEYEIRNQADELLTTGETTLVFVDMKTRRPIKCPDYILKKL